MSYLDTVHDVYKAAALTPQSSLCCVTQPPFRAWDLHLPEAMLAMNYGCGSTVQAHEVRPDDTVLYVGVGGGLEALQFAWATRQPGGVIAVDSVPEMLAKARENFLLAGATNPWFQPDFVTLVQGNALDLPIADGAVTIAAQNCLFNVFEEADLTTALREIARVLAPGGRLYLSDPVATRPIPAHLAGDARLRAECLSGALPLADYLSRIVAAGFGTIEIRSKRPYRLLDRQRYGLEAPLLLESVELVAIKSPVPADGPCIFTGQAVIYVGEAASFDDGRGHVLMRDVPLSVCEKTAAWFTSLQREDLFVTPPTYFYQGGGCC